MITKSRLVVILLILTCLNICIVVYVNLNKYLEKYSHEKMAKVYSESQYVKGSLATEGIGDDGLFAVAGYYLLFQGGDPSQIHFESPPFGEYLIGFSTLIFKNERVISLVYGLLFLLYTYKLVKYVVKSNLMAALSVFLLSLDRLFHNQLTLSLLDLPQALFLLIGIYYFLLARENRTYLFFISSLFFGFAFSTKFFPGIIFFVSIMLILLYRKRKKALSVYIASLFLIPVVFLLSYTMYFYHHHSIFEFINFQKYVIRWRMGNPIGIGNIFLTMILGKYRSWWDNSWVDYNEWTFITLYLFLTSIMSIIIKQFRKNHILNYCYSIFIVFLAYITFGTTGVAKYLLPVYPFMLMFSTYVTIYLFRLI